MRVDAIKVRVLIEGVRLSLVTMVSVQTFANEQARASISFPSVPGFEAEELKRARVHIFWSDIETRENVADDEWPLLFEGEIVADSYNKTPTQRTQVFHCEGYHTYWQQVLLYFYDPSHPMPSQGLWADRLAVSLGNERLEWEARVAGLNLRQRLISDLDENKSLSYQSIVRKVFGQSLDVNHFFRRANERLALDRRFVTPKDENLGVLVDIERLREGMNQDILTISGEKPMMDVLKSILQLFRYQIINNSQPVLVDERVREQRTAQQIDASVSALLSRAREFLEELGTSDTVTDSVVSQLSARTTDAAIATMAQSVVTDIDDETQLTTVTEELTAIRNLLVDASDPTTSGGEQLDRGTELLSQFMLLPDTRFALPPTCNVIFPQDQMSFGLERQLMQEPTRGISTPFTDSGVPMSIMLAPPELNAAVVPTRTINPVSPTGYSNPVRGTPRISSPFGIKRRITIRHETTNRVHKGVDIAVATGTDVYSMDDGKVVFAGWQDPTDPNKGAGQYVAVAHGNGILTQYFHLSWIGVVKGQQVSSGELIGKAGNTGHSKGPHLHLEVKVDGIKRDPAKYLYLSSDGSRLAEPPPATGAVANTAVETDEESILDVASRGDDTFTDYRYLSPEEQRTGIIPFFDLKTARAHSFMSFAGSKASADDYLLQLLNSEFLWRRYQSRHMNALTLPFNPSPVAGFPTLVVDRNRSIIGQIASVAHTINVGGGQGNASTTVQVQSPRYWDEGDPYYWVDGEAKYSPQNGRNLPDPDRAAFPAYYLTSLVPENSASDDVWWDAEVKTPTTKRRAVDDLYSQLLGPGVRGIPYSYASRPTNLGTTVTYNKAIAKRTAFFNAETNRYEETRGGGDKNTIVGRYYYLLARDPRLAEEYVRNLTRRRGVSERDLMQRVLNASTADNGRSYSADAFVVQYQATVKRLNEILGADNAFRG